MDRSSMPETIVQKAASTYPGDDGSFRALLQSELPGCEEARVKEPYQEGYEN